MCVCEALTGRYLYCEGLIPPVCLNQSVQPVDNNVTWMRSVLVSSSTRIPTLAGDLHGLLCASSTSEEPIYARFLGHWSHFIEDNANIRDFWDPSAAISLS